MFLTTVKLHGLPAKRKEIILTLQELAKRMKSVSGCSKADLYQDVLDKNKLYFLEECPIGPGLEQDTKSEFAAVLRGMQSLLAESVEIIQAKII